MLKFVKITLLKALTKKKKKNTHTLAHNDGSVGRAYNHVEAHVSPKIRTSSSTKGLRECRNKNNGN